MDIFNNSSNSVPGCYISSQKQRSPKLNTSWTNPIPHVCYASWQLTDFLCLLRSCFSCHHFYTVNRKHFYTHPAQSSACLIPINIYLPVNCWLHAKAVIYSACYLYFLFTKWLNRETEISGKIGLDTILLFKILSTLIAQSNFYNFQLWDDLLPLWRESVYSSVIYVPSSKLFFVALTLTAHIRETGSHH